MSNEQKNNQQQGGNFVLVQRQAQDSTGGNQLSFRDYIWVFTN